MTTATPETDAELEQRLIEASHVGMTTAVWAELKPDAVAIFDPHGTRTFAELNAGANRVTRMLRDHGLKPGEPSPCSAPTAPSSSRCCWPTSAAGSGSPR
jgi:non-ribosomal peptide synthetase component F